MNYTTGEWLTYGGLVLLAIALETLCMYLIYREAFGRGFDAGVKAERGRLANLAHKTQVRKFQVRGAETPNRTAKVRSVRLMARRWPKNDSER